MTNDFKPFDYGRSMSIFLSDYMYTTPEVSVREMISNARDQYLDESTFNKPNHNKVFIIVDPLRKKFRLVDYATGIINPDFQMMGSNTLGKIVGSRISTVENPDEEMIGQFHVGKASFAKMSTVAEGPVVSFYSNNGKEGLILQMLIRNTDIGKELGWEDPPYRLPPKLIHEAREEREIGLTVEVHDVIDKLLRVSYVKRVVGEQFGILLSRKHLHVFVKDGTAPNAEWDKVKASSDLDCTREEKLNLDRDHFMSHCLSVDEKPPYDNIKICVKHVFIKSIHVPYKVKGWINYNRLRLNGPRDAFLTDDRHDEMMKYFSPLLDERFEKQHNNRDPKPKGLKDLTKLFGKMIKQVIELYDRDPLILSGVFNDHSDMKGNILDTNKNKIENLHKQNGPISPTGKGNEGEPIEGEILIPVPRKRGKRGKGKGRGTGGGDETTWQIDEENGKEREYFTGALEEQRPQTGPIEPVFRIEDREIGIEKPITYMENPMLLILNPSQPAMYGILRMQDHYRQTSLAPFMAEALAEFITRNRQTPTSIVEYRQMVNDIYTSSLFSGIN